MTSCETEVELLAPYDETPVIYGVLDYTADTQFVRINKTFLGEGDPAQYAAIQDSVEYDPADVKAIIYKLNNSGNQLDSFPLETIVLPSREPGVFYNQDVLFYFTDKPLLTENQQNDQSDFIFELDVTIKGERYTAQTRFPGLDAGSIARPFLTNGDPQRFSFATTGAVQAFSSDRYAFITDNFSASYSAASRLNFDYYTNSGDTVRDQFIDFELGTFDNPELSDGNELTISVFGENLYTFWASQLDLIPDLKGILIEDLEFRLTAATPELTTYLEVVQPVSQFTPVLNSFTNISNGGIGIFTSKDIGARRHWLNEASMKMLIENEVTNRYEYCAKNWTGTNYNCSE
jgi:hypothetical protein